MHDRTAAIIIPEHDVSAPCDGNRADSLPLLGVHMSAEPK